MGRRYNQNAGIVRVVDNMLSDQNASFNCLAQPDLIGQQISLNRIGKHPTNNVDLMLQEFNSGRREATKTTDAGSLRSQAAHDSGTAIKKTWSVGDASGQIVRGIGNWARPPYVQLRDWNAP